MSDSQTIKPKDKLYKYENGTLARIIITQPQHGGFFYTFANDEVGFDLPQDLHNQGWRMSAMEACDLV